MKIEEIWQCKKENENIVKRDKERRRRKVRKERRQRKTRM